MTYRKAKGGKELQRYLLDNKRLSPRQMVIAKCYECMEGYIDGKIDCGIPECPCYGLMPYNGQPKIKSGRKGNMNLGKVKRGIKDRND